MSGSLVALSLLLDKINDVDKDHRYMATSDLARELQSPHLVLGATESSRVVHAVMKQLNDASGDISGLANTCLATLAKKLDGLQLESLCTMLLCQMTSDTDEVKRDVAYLGLKTVVQNMDVGEMQQGDRVVDSLGVWLKECIMSERDEVASNGYDVLLVYLQTHGPMFSNSTDLADFCVNEFEQRRPGIRKKAMQCLGTMAGSLPMETFHQVCCRLLGSMRQCLDSDMERAHTLLMAMACIGRGAGYRMESHVSELLDVCLGLASRSLKEGDDGVDVAEACLVIFEICVTNCSNKASEYMTPMTDIAIRGVTYDPNYADDSDMEDASEEYSMEEDVSEYDDDDDDDDDSSWKVRRAACKVLVAELQVFRAEIEGLFQTCYKTVMKRVISEREEIVRQDLFTVCMDMLSIIGDNKSARVYALLQAELESTVCTLSRTLKKQPAKMKVFVYKTLEIIVRIDRNVFIVALSKCSNDIVMCLSDDSFSSLQVNVLQFLEVGFETPNGCTSLEDFVVVSDEIFKCTQRKRFALVAAAIKVCQKMVYLIRPNISEPISNDMACLVLPFFVTISDCLSGSDKPQEVKNAAIDCVGDAIARMGDLLDGTQVEALANDFAAMPSNSKRAKIQGSNQYSTGHLPRLEDIVSLLVERLDNEMTRLAALNALKKIIESPLHLSIGDTLGDATSSIKSYLRKLDRQTRIMSLETLSSLITYKAGSWTCMDISNIVDDVSGLISDNDLGVSNAAMSLLENVATTMPEVAPSLFEKTFNHMQELLSSPTLQSSSLDHLQTLLEKLAIQMSTNHTMVVESFVDFGYRSNEKHSSMAIATCVATLAACSQDAASYLSSQLSSLSCCDKSQRIFLLYCIKEAGAAKLSLQDTDALREAIVLCMEDELSSEAAASALGGLASGSNSSHLDYICKALSEPKDKRAQYHMLCALVEALRIISRSGGMIDAQIQAGIEKSVTILIQMNLDDDNNEEILSIIAQCYGLAAYICPDTVLPTFKSQLDAQDARRNIMALSGIRCAIGEVGNAIDDHLKKSFIPEAMKKLSDGNVSVRRSATLLLGLAAHNKLFLVQELLPSCMPALIEQTKPDPSLIRVVNLGPFKHKIDDGLEQRKSAFDCLGILISKCWGTLPNQKTILDAIVGGLSDQYEVKLKCHDLIIVLSQLSPKILLLVLDQVVQPLTKTLTTRVKPDAVRQEVDRNEDMLRSCLRAIDALDRIDGSHGILDFKTFLQNVVHSDAIASKFRAIVKERKQIEYV